MADIPKQVTTSSNEDSELPQSVAEMPQDTTVPEINPYVISFAKYKKKLCEIKDLHKNNSRKALSILKEIGTKVFSRVDFQKHNIKTKGIANSGDYKKLYNGFEPDIEVKEIRIQGDARIFYYDVEPERILYIVAITENHYETDKVKR